MNRREISDYRPNVCAVIRNSLDNRLLFCHRKGFLSTEGWQFPQGGYDVSLNLIDEMRRELREEISVDDVEVVSISDKEYFYDFPVECYRKKGGFRGQRQKWVLSYLLSGEETINVDTEFPEFDTWRWVTPDEALELIVDFKRECYREAMSDLGII